MENLLRHKLILITIGIQLLALPLILFAVKERQETITQAVKATTLSFSPASNTASPITKNVGEDFSVDVMLSPGSNLISLVKLEILYDPTKISLSATNPLIVNSGVFPQIVEGPVYSSGKIQIVLSVGPDQTKVIQTDSKALTLNLKAQNSSNETLVSYGPNNAAYSIAPGDSANENVISTMVPATIKVNAAPTPSFTPAPTNTPSPLPTSTPTPLPSPTPTPSPTPVPPSPTPLPTGVPTPINTVLNLNNLKLHGIGKGGDSPNPNSPGTQNPLHPTRSLTVEIYNTSGTLLNSITADITYSPSSGYFSGSFTAPSTLASGSYLIKVKTPQYLRKQLPGFINLVKSQANTLAQATLIVGDVNGDNALTVADYDLIMDCYSDLTPAKNCDASKKISADLSDDGRVNYDDYNLFLRELSVQQGE